MVMYLVQVMTLYCHANNNSTTCAQTKLSYSVYIYEYLTHPRKEFKFKNCYVIFVPVLLSKRQPRIHLEQKSLQFVCCVGTNY